MQGFAQLIVTAGCLLFFYQAFARKGHKGNTWAGERGERGATSSLGSTIVCPGRYPMKGGSKQMGEARSAFSVLMVPQRKRNSLPKFQEFGGRIGWVGFVCARWRRYCTHPPLLNRQHRSRFHRIKAIDHFPSRTTAHVARPQACADSRRGTDICVYIYELRVVVGGDDDPR